MNPKQHRTSLGDKTTARTRREVAEKYFEVAELIATETGASINVCVGTAILAGIAAGDAICLAAIGQRYAGPDHNAAAKFLGDVDQELGKVLRNLVQLKAAAHYGDHLLTPDNRKTALRQAAKLTQAARQRTT